MGMIDREKSSCRGGVLFAKRSSGFIEGTKTKDNTSWSRWNILCRLSKLWKANKRF